MKIIRQSAGRRPPGVSVLCPDPRVNQPDRPARAPDVTVLAGLRLVEQMYE